MNKQELIKYFEELPYVSITQMGKKSFIDLIEQLDEPEKAKVPWFVAEYIKWAKKEDFHLLGAMNRENFDKKLDDWFYTDDNIEVFARAWLDGYEVGEEKHFRVKVKGICGNHETLNCEKHSNEWLFSSSEENRTYKTKFTLKELEGAGFGWVFDCERIEIEEV